MVYSRDPWRDRFHSPTASDLRATLDADATASFDRVRRDLMKIDGITETTAWYGDGWYWTIEYRLPRRKDPLVVVIPSPEDLQLGMLIDAEFVAELLYRRLRRGIRDGLELACDPYDTRWAIWSMAGGSALLEDLRDLVKRRQQFLLSQ